MKLLTMSLLAVLILALVSPAMAQKFGYVDYSRFETEYPEWVKAQEQFDADMKSWSDSADLLQRELQDMYNDYKKQELILSAEKKQERMAEINAKNDALQAYTNDIQAPGGKAEARQRELMEPLLQKIQDAVDKIAIENNYDFIFKSFGLAYGRKDLDITDKVLEELATGDY